MMKIYKFWEKGNKNNREFIAASNYDAAMKTLVNDSKLNSKNTKGEVLLRKNPTSSKDYLKLDIPAGIVPKEIEFEYFGGKKSKINSIRPEIKKFIKKEIREAVEDYFESKLPKFK